MVNRTEYNRLEEQATNKLIDLKEINNYFLCRELKLMDIKKRSQRPTDKSWLRGSIFNLTNNLTIAPFFHICPSLNKKMVMLIARICEPSFLYYRDLQSRVVERFSRNYLTLLLFKYRLKYLFN